MLSEAGYVTGNFGKWHLGDTDVRYPTDQGFDEWIGIPRSSDRAFWPDSNSFEDNSHPDVEFAYIMSSVRGKKPKRLAVYDRLKRALIDKEITENAIGFIKRQAAMKKPFFVFIPYTQTHESVDPHPDFFGTTGHGNFSDVLAQTDSYIGQLNQTIEEIGLKNDTIFISTSDNGREGVQRSFGFTGPWRGSMFSPYEGSVRVPFLIRWPERIPEKQVSNELVHQIDVFPTITNWANGKVREDRVIDGADQSAFLMGFNKKSARESSVICIGNELFGAKWRNWKILIKEMDESGYGIKNMAYSSIYNLIVDPKEEVPELNYLNDTRVDFPLYQVLEDHQASIKKDSGTLGPQCPVFSRQSWLPGRALQ